MDCFIVTSCDYRTNVRTYIHPEVFTRDFLALQEATRLKKGDKWIVDDYEYNNRVLKAWSNKIRTRTIKVEFYELRQLPEIITERRQLSELPTASVVE